MASLYGGVGLVLVVVGDLALGSAAPFESTQKDDKEVYQTLFKDNKAGKRSAYQSTIHLDDARGQTEAAWTRTRFKSKLQSHQTYDAWIWKVMVIPR